MRYRGVIAYWDTQSHPAPLGALFIFIEECLLICDKLGVSKLEIAIRDRAANKTIISVLQTLSCINNIHFYENVNDLSALLEGSHFGWFSWPSVERLSIKNGYDTTLHVQYLWSELKVIRPLRVNEASFKKAQSLINNHFSGSRVVAIHLKNIPHKLTGDSVSNAHQEEWLKFFERAHIKYRINFILLGKDEVDKRIKKLSNVFSANQLGIKAFEEQLALLLSCDGFMGMMSSFATFAIFSEVPYILFKNPQHHSSEMKEEIGDDDHYCFSQSTQKIFRLIETDEILLEGLKKVLKIKDEREIYASQK